MRRLERSGVILLPTLFLDAARAGLPGSQRPDCGLGAPPADLPLRGIATRRAKGAA